MGEVNWQPQARCNSLSPHQADAIFFPTVGKKSNTAVKFCSPCPVRQDCIKASVEGDLDGFYGGLTKKDRRRLAVLMQIQVVPIEAVMPEEPVRSPRKARYLSVVKAPDPHDWLDA